MDGPGQRVGHSTIGEGEGKEPDLLLGTVYHVDDQLSAAIVGAERDMEGRPTQLHNGGRSRFSR